ncbi:MAG: hypothetical protein CVU90_14100 [Firmicutes bacterium HGW-Firmicutes-15]|nr:MAG: hypothetical protein CVU90_14100 [Firmicutes bacterium HGW-Firmicutes-15]
MPNYKHFLEMTDEVGMLQFSRQGKPDPRSGYTLDDNARALLVALFMGEDAYPYARRFLNYLALAQRPDGTWSNFLLDGKYISRFDSEDSIGRAIMACSAATRSNWPDLAAQASHLLLNNLPWVRFFSSPRAIAYTLVGLCKGKMPCTDKNLHELVTQLSNSLVGLYKKTRSRDWMWFEDYLTYCNAILPHALFSVYSLNGDKKCLKIAHESLSFLNGILFSKGYLNIIGNQGWYHRGGSLPSFDQQPVDAASIAFACWEAYQNLGKRDYVYIADLAHQWYRGHNIHGLSLVNEANGGCYDALNRDGVNLNQGAEAVLSLLLTDLLIDGSISQEFNAVKSS